MDFEQMAERIEKGEGFIAALDQSGGSTPKALRAYGVDDSEWDGEEEMFERIHEMRERVITAPAFSCGKVIGAILFERTMEGMVDGQSAADALKARSVVPFLKVDEGLASEADGVQLMKELTRLDELLDKARAHGMFGTKMRSVIKSANPAGIAAAVAQQFHYGHRIAQAGLVPILEPEYDITAEDRAAGEQILRDEILKNLDALPEGERVMLKLSIPVEPNFYADVIEHPRVLRVVALSGGYSTEEACRLLARNKGMIASFSRGLLQDLRKDQDDADFNAALQRAIDAICDASLAG